MSSSRSELPDKIIVDRRKSYRNSDVRNAVRNTRSRLAERGITDAGFDTELLARYARSIKISIAPTVLMIVMIVGAALSLGLGAYSIIWGAMMVIAIGALGLLAHHFLNVSPKERGDRKWLIVFLAMHGGLGVLWAWFAVTSCTDCAAPDQLMLKAVCLLIAIAARTTISHELRWSVFAEFSLPVAVYIVTSDPIGDPRATAASATVLTAFLFFAFVAIRLQKASLASVSYRSENKALIAELEMARSISEEARRRAEEANLAKSRFLASMSHELRTPLNAILGFSEVMANEVLGPMENETYRSYAQDIHNSGTHLLTLINEILDLSRIEAGKQELIEEPLHLAQVVADCIGLVQLKADQKQITVEHIAETDMPRLLADERSVRQVGLNILSNAVKFTPSGGKILVKTGWTATGGQYVSVKDNGPGIPEDEIPVVLSAFGQGSIAIKSAEQGTGLGLPIVQALMAMHGGTFKLTSRLREGTKAIAFFPPERVLVELPAQPFDIENQPRRRQAAG
ncbi:sensor histidine kinase [Oricola sp.]|uniref:sensor histidine kinase n=1 Tax=Oricola sp. TaxID=1979950 RepID=UPI003BACB9F4